MNKTKHITQEGGGMNENTPGVKGTVASRAPDIRGVDEMDVPAGVPVVQEPEPLPPAAVDAFARIMGDPTMPPDESPAYDRWLFVKAWDAGVAAALGMEVIPAHGVSLPLPPNKDRIETLWQQWSVAGQVMYRQGFENALSTAGVNVPVGWLYDFTHSSALGKPDEHVTVFTTDEARARQHDNARPVYGEPPAVPSARDRAIIRTTWEFAGASKWIDEDTIAAILAAVSGVRVGDPVQPFGWLFEGPEGLRQFTKAQDFTKPVLDLHRRMAQEQPDKYTLTALYAGPDGVMAAETQQGKKDA